MIQGYFLAVLYMILGSGLLLVDYYGGKLLIFIRLKNSLRTNFRTQLLLLLGGLAIVAIKILFPILPGPILIGDFIPVVVILLLVVYCLTFMVRFKQKGEQAVKEEGRRFEKEMLERTEKLIEKNKRNLGFVVLACALMHFLFPQAVLL